MIHNIAARKVRIWLAFFVFGAGGVSGSAIGVAWLSIRDTWELPTASLGILLLALTTGFLTGSFVSGRLVTRFGMGNTLVLSNVVTAIGLLGFGLAPDWFALIAIAILSGLGKGTLGASLNIYFANHFNARMMNWLHASFSIGATLGPFIVHSATVGGSGWARRMACPGARPAAILLRLLPHAWGLALVSPAGRRRSDCYASHAGHTA